MQIPKAGDFQLLGDAEAQEVRAATLLGLESSAEGYLEAYSTRFGNVLNADDAATLFERYNADRARFRVAVHPAATWIRDELFERALRAGVPGGIPGGVPGGSVVFTAGSNAAGKSTAIRFTQADRHALCIFDSTFSNLDHARRLVAQALAAGKRLIILYVDRPLELALEGMLERGRYEGRFVTIQQMIKSHEGAAETVRSLSREFNLNPRVVFRFIANSDAGVSEGSVTLATERDYTLIRKRLYELLDAEYVNRRISEPIYRRVRGE
jgi:hypothetical protein